MRSTKTKSEIVDQTRGGEDSRVSPLIKFASIAGVAVLLGGTPEVGKGLSRGTQPIGKENERQRLTWLGHLSNVVRVG